jgi:hypothetical protein
VIKKSEYGTQKSQARRMPGLAFFERTKVARNTASYDWKIVAADCIATAACWSAPEVSPTTVPPMIIVLVSRARLALTMRARVDTVFIVRSFLR